MRCGFWFVGKVLSEGLLFFCNGCVGMAVFGATGGASKASDRCSFTKISENNKDWCNGRGKPTPLRKASGIVRFWRGWCEA